MDHILVRPEERYLVRIIFIIYAHCSVFNEHYLKKLAKNPPKIIFKFNIKFTVIVKEKVVM